MDEDEFETYLSELLHALRTERRRRVVELLFQSPSASLSVRDIAREIAATEYDIPRKQATGEPYRNAYNALSQTHLPTLRRADIVIYDPHRQTVSPGPNLTLAELLIAINRPAIETMQRTNDREWTHWRSRGAIGDR